MTTMWIHPHPIRNELASLLHERRQLIRDHALAEADAVVERSGVHHEYYIKPFDDADDWLQMRDTTLNTRTLKAQRIQRLPRSVYGPAYYMSRLVTNALDINASYNLMGMLPDSGRGTAV